jgi:nucleoside phosphorylase
MEAQSFLNNESFSREWSSESATFYIGEKFDILITGIGPVCSAFACGQIAKYTHKEWVNFGIAGDLSRAFEIGSVVEITACKAWPHHNPLQPHLNEIIFGENGEKLITVSEPIHNEEKRSLLSKMGTLVDMEGYAIALSAKLINKKLRMTKIVSDHADGKNKKKLIASIPPLMEILYKKFITKI